MFEVIFWGVVMFHSMKPNNARFKRSRTAAVWISSRRLMCCIMMYHEKCGSNALVPKCDTLVNTNGCLTIDGKK